MTVAGIYLPNAFDCQALRDRLDAMTLSGLDVATVERWRALLDAYETVRRFDPDKIREVAESVKNESDERDKDFGKDDDSWNEILEQVDPGATALDDLADDVATDLGGAGCLREGDAVKLRADVKRVVGDYLRAAFENRRERIERVGGELRERANDGALTLKSISVDLLAIVDPPKPDPKSHRRSRR